MAESQLKTVETRRPDGAVGLTDRERDALAWVAKGKSDWEISRILGVSEATARFHVDNARRKLGAANRAHAVARMAVAGLLYGPV